MAETGDQNHEGEKKEGRIARKLREIREQKIADREDIGKIYESLKNPGGKEVYEAWVNNMDVVANAMSLGREKPRLRTLLLKAANRIVGVGAAALAVPADLVVDAITWLPRKKAPLGGFIPTHVFARHTMYMAKSAKAEGLALGGLVFGVKGAYDVGKIGAEAAKMQGKALLSPPKLYAKVAGEAVKTVIHGNAEIRAPIIALKRKAERIAGGILHPQRA